MSEEDDGKPEVLEPEGDRPLRCPTATDHAIEIYKIYIAYIRHENELIHQRAGRFIGIQAALIATVGLVLQKYFEIISLHGRRDASDVTPVYFFLLCVAIVGLISAIAALTSLLAARNAQFATYEAYAERGYGRDASLIGLPALMGGGAESERPTIPKSDRRGGTFLVYLPITLMILWLLTGTWLALFRIPTTPLFGSAPPSEAVQHLAQNRLP